MKLRESHEKLQGLKDRRKVLREAIAQGLEQSKSYTEAKEAFEEARRKMNMHKEAVMNDYKREQEELDRLKLEIKDQEALITDVAITELMKGETVEIEKTPEEDRLLPTYKVTFKRPN